MSDIYAVDPWNRHARQPLARNKKEGAAWEYERTSEEEENTGSKKEGAGKTPQETRPRMTCRQSVDVLLEADR